MKNLFLFALLTMMCVFNSSCKDDDDDHNDDAAVEYHAHIMSPDAEDKNVGDDIHIHVNFEEHDGATIHHVNVKIYNKDDNSIIIFDEPSEAHVHADGTHEVHGDVTLDGDVLEHTDWIMEAKAWGHEAGEHEVMETVEFHVHPE